MSAQHEPKSKYVPKVIWASIIGVSLAMTKLKSHCVMREAAITRERTAEERRASADFWVPLKPAMSIRERVVGTDHG